MEFARLKFVISILDFRAVEPAAQEGGMCLVGPCLFKQNYDEKKAFIWNFPAQHVKKKKSRINF